MRWFLRDFINTESDGHTLSYDCIRIHKKIRKKFSYELLQYLPLHLRVDQLSWVGKEN